MILKKSKIPPFFFFLPFLCVGIFFFVPKHTLVPPRGRAKRECNVIYYYAKDLCRWEPPEPHIISPISYTNGCDTPFFGPFYCPRHPETPTKKGVEGEWRLENVYSINIIGNAGHEFFIRFFW